MDLFRYGLALLLVCGVPPLVVAWPVVHRGIRFWRGVGPRVTYAVVLGCSAAIASVCYAFRDQLLGADHGARWPLIAAGVLLLVVAAWLRVRLNRDFTAAQLMGLPELMQPGGNRPGDKGLVRTGLFSRIRHPRYVQFGIALLGHALIANYTGGYAACLLWAPGAYMITLFEERELRERFGQAYEAYARETPRFVPKWRRGA